ncbi:MAG TPA: hypothetical protein VMS65_06155 [Polyangiaceae bacterium]|nr:hypothetical protein [Polyangiaceae bacterium]
MARYERWTAIVSAGLIFGALLACKKKGSEATEASASAAVVAPPPPPPAPTAAPADTPKLGDVKRYADKEKKSDEAAVRVLSEDLKIFNEADSKTPEVATLPKDALVFRLAELDGFQLVEFPSGIGQFSQGWVEAKGLSDKPVKVAREAVLSEKKVATVKTDGGVAPKASGSASANPSATATASATASASASSSGSKAVDRLNERALRRAAERAKAADAGVKPAP